jgi:surface polysaccharide O-acyltransferase-like enzyme
MVYSSCGGVIKKYSIYIVSILSVIVTILYVHFTGDYNNGYSDMNIFIFLYSIGVFCLLVDLKISTNQKRDDIVKTLSRLTFGVYIVHPLVLQICTWIQPYTKLPLVYIVLKWVITCCISFVLCYITSKIMFIRKLIRM